MTQREFIDCVCIGYGTDEVIERAVAAEQKPETDDERFARQLQATAVRDEGDPPMFGFIVDQSVVCTDWLDAPS